METTAEQQTTDITDTSKYSHDEVSTRPCAYIQLLVDPLCGQDKPHSENHNSTEELLQWQLAPEPSPSIPHFSASDPKDSEPERNSADPTTNTPCSAASVGITTNEVTLQKDEIIPLFPSWRDTPGVQLDNTVTLQIISHPSSTTIQFPLAHLCEVDDRVPSSSPLGNQASSLPPSSSPPQMFSSSPFASSQSSHVEIDDYKIKDRGITTGPGGQDSISSPDVVHLDIVEETHSNQHDPTDVDHKREKHELEYLSIQARNSRNDKDGYDNQQVSNSLMRKRPWTEEKINIAPFPGDIQLTKRLRTHHAQAYLPPAPKRATLASQQQQFKKLIAPFRSPFLMLKKDEGAPSGDPLDSKSSMPVLPPPPIPKLPVTPHKPHPQHVHVAPSITPAKTRVRTLKAASQFKSPLSSSASASSGRGLSIRLTPTVQSLERKLQLLRRAVKVKEKDEEITLVGLVNKWTEAGREVAYELWDLVKDSADNGDGLRASAWDGGASKGRSGSEDRNWGWDFPGIKYEERPENDMDATTDNLLELAYTNKIHSEDETRNNMGTMLRRLGIDPGTLGWDEDTEVFIG